MSNSNLIEIHNNQLYPQINSTERKIIIEENIPNDDILVLKPKKSAETSKSHYIPTEEMVVNKPSISKEIENFESKLKNHNHSNFIINSSHENSLNSFNNLNNFNNINNFNDSNNLNNLNNVDNVGDQDNENTVRDKDYKS